MIDTLSLVLSLNISKRLIAYAMKRACRTDEAARQPLVLVSDSEIAKFQFEIRKVRIIIPSVLYNGVHLIYYLVMHVRSD